MRDGVASSNGSRRTAVKAIPGFSENVNTLEDTQDMADVTVFPNSKASRLVQVAGHVAHAVLRRFNAGDAEYFDVILSRFFTADVVAMSPRGTLLYIISTCNPRSLSESVLTGGAQWMLRLRRL